MNNKILIDASHHEETRVVVLDNDNNIEHFEIDIPNKKTLKGNIYLGKITKIEKSLQAVFVDYGEGKQGFLPFNQIHLQYFNITQEAKDTILNQQKEYKENKRKKSIQEESELLSADDSETNDDQELITTELNSNNNVTGENDTKTDTNSTIATKNNTLLLNDDNEEEDDDFQYSAEYEEGYLKQIEEENLSYGTRFGYKLEDVIVTDTLVIVQVTKEERGNKGATLTTYLSIAGRCCVLMPNTPFEGGISKKITNINNRNRLRNLIKNLNINPDNNLVIRTASNDKTDAEIIYDYKYVNSIWNFINKNACNQQIGLLLEETSLIKRVVRDLYSADLNQLIVEDRTTYDELRSFAQMIAPELINKIKRYQNSRISLFQYYKIEKKINDIYSPIVFLPSGAYIVIQATEALTAIDINSGKIKGKRNVEETALTTNLEAAEEIVRQIQLREIGGIIVIDFIDMENNKNNQTIERKVKELLKNDKAKVHISGISEFGLLQISRQRLRSSLAEKSLEICSSCQGLGYKRPLELNALDILRSIEKDLLNYKNKNISKGIIIHIAKSEALYLLNHKRYNLHYLEKSFGHTIEINYVDHIAYPYYKIEIAKDDNKPTDTLLFDKLIEDHIKQAPNKQTSNNVTQNNNTYKKNNRNNNYKRHKKYNEQRSNQNQHNKQQYNQPATNTQSDSNKKGFISKILGFIK